MSKEIWEPRTGPLSEGTSVREEVALAEGLDAVEEEEEDKVSEAIKDSNKIEGGE